MTTAECLDPRSARWCSSLRLPLALAGAASWCGSVAAVAARRVDSQQLLEVFVHLRPKYFGEIIANLLLWLGPDKLLFGSGCAIWSPKWLIEKFMAHQLPEDLKEEYHVDLTPEIKRKILNENATRLYGIDIAAQTAKFSRDGLNA